MNQWDLLFETLGWLLADIDVYGYTNTLMHTFRWRWKHAWNTHTRTHKYQHRQTDFVRCPHHFLQVKHRRRITCLQLDACCCAPWQFLECVTDDVCIVHAWYGSWLCGLQEDYPHNIRQTILHKREKVILLITDKDDAAYQVISALFNFSMFCLLSVFG